MATIKLNPLITDIRKKMDNMVFSRWKDTNYVRQHVVPKNTNTKEQAKVRSAFGAVVEIWQLCNPLIALGWKRFAADKNYTGFNAFIAENANRLRANEPLELFKENGINVPANFTVTPGANPGQLQCSFESAAPAHSISLFVHQLQEEDTKPKLQRYDFASDTSSPLTIDGLTPASNYHIYMIQCDTSFESASLNSKAAVAAITLP